MIPGTIDEINNRKDLEVDLHLLQDNNDNKGWNSNISHDFVDIKLVRGVEMTKIRVLKGSNVKKFEIWYENIYEDLFKVKVYLLKIALIFLSV